MVSAAGLMTALALYAAATAAPVKLDARFSSQEVVYLSLTADSAGTLFYEAEYYANIGHSHNQQAPDSTSIQIPMDNKQLWSQYSFHFPSSGVTFTSNIRFGAAPPSVPVGGEAGTGSNPKPFTCYVDNGNVLYNKNGQSYYKEYYCRPNYVV